MSQDPGLSLPQRLREEQGSGAESKTSREGKAGHPGAILGWLLLRMNEGLAGSVSRGEAAPEAMGPAAGYSQHSR